MFQCLECDAPVSIDNYFDDDSLDDDPCCPRCGSTDIDLYIEPDRQLTVRDVYPVE